MTKMTETEAIECNKNLREYMEITDKESEYHFLEENYIALDMAIKALDKCDKIEQIINDWDNVPWCKSNTVMQVTLLRIAEVLKKEKE